MTQKSFICRLIDAHPDDWRKICEMKQIGVKDEGNLSIFNYDIGANFYDPVVQEARGIIIDTEEKTVACWPFRKFGNSHEPYADTIDWSSAIVQEKVDGSIVKLWYDKRAKLWRWSSNSCIKASNAGLATGLNVEALIEQTKEWDILRNMIWNCTIPSVDYTYIFELVGPYNQVVIRYPETKLYHIGTRNNKTGEERTDIDLGIDKPKVYPLHSLDDCVHAASELNRGEFPDNEGFVVMDKDFHRVKVKCPEYLIYHHAVANGKITKERAWDILKSDDFNLETFLKEVSNLVSEPLLYYKDNMEKTRADAIALIEATRKDAADGKSRKDIALSIKDNPLSYFAFKGLNSDEDAETIINNEGIRIMKTIPDYQFKFT